VNKLDCEILPFLSRARNWKFAEYDSSQVARNLVLQTKRSRNFSDTDNNRLHLYSWNLDEFSLRIAGAKKKSKNRINARNYMEKEWNYLVIQSFVLWNCCHINESRKTCLKEHTTTKKKEL
jgi:hypothetical protein